MIIGIATLIAMLFGGGSFEVFFLADFEKGVKEYVIEKDRQKEILSDLKESKKIFKDFNKERNSDYKLFKKMNESRLTTETDFSVFFEDIQKRRVLVQNELIDSRITVNDKIHSMEWDSIIAFSKNSVDKSLEKAQKKADKKSDKKTKEAFSNTRKTISERVVDSEKQKNISGGLDGLILTLEELSSNLATITNENLVIITGKDASKSDLLKMAGEMNELRILTYKELVSFHMLVKENTNVEKFEKIMKSFNKELTITNR